MHESTITRTPHKRTAVARQRGIVVPIVVIGLLAILAVAGMALDGSHALANKTRMQNTVDAAALAAAKVLDTTSGDTGLATAAANSLFSINAGGVGNHELNNAYSAGDITVTVQYSTLVNPFTPGSPNGPFVRVIATGFDTQTTMSRVLGINDIPTPATAVAGPSGPIGTGTGATACDIAPIAVCLEDTIGADQEALRVLKPNPGLHEDIGPGNYKMLRLDCSGDACLRRNMAGSGDDVCATEGATVETEPGVSSGPVSQGFNTRFNEYQGAGLNADDYPPDLYIEQQGQKTLKSCGDPNDPTTEYIFLTTGQGNNYCKDFGDGFDPLTEDPADWPAPYGGGGLGGNGDFVKFASEINYNYCNYSGIAPPDCGNQSGPGPSPGNLTGGGEKNRRLLIFPTITCAGNENGQATLDVEGFACFFMLQALPNGQADGAGQIFGQFIETCPAAATGGINPGGGPSPLLYKIQLYKDPDSGDS